MSARTTTKRRLMAALSAPLVMAGLVMAPATTAQAHDNISVEDAWRDTSKCWCYLPDSYDGTYFQHDSGGVAYKGEIYSGQEMVGKVEFHPHDDTVWLYDTKANGDALYLAAEWMEDGSRKTAHMKSKSGAYVNDLDIPEGTTVTIRVWDDGYWSNASEILMENAVA